MNEISSLAIHKKYPNIYLRKRLIARKSKNRIELEQEGVRHWERARKRQRQRRRF
jgi:hypothetical protein